MCQVPGIGDIGGLVGLCAQGSSGIVGDLNNICEPSLPQPEQATGGIDAMIEPPAASAGGKTLYDNYGIAGQFWAAHGLQCSDMTSLIGNNVAGMVFDAAKSLDRVTITVYQSAAGNNILTWLQNAVDRLISALGNAIYFPYLAPVVILGAIWLAWQGLIRKRATRTIEGTLWMVVACVAAIALIGKPADFTGVGTTVSNGVTGVLNTAFSKLPTPAGSNCLPVQAGDPQSVTSNFAFTSGNGLVDQNANELWSVLVCKPWLWAELGTTAYAAPGAANQTVVNTYGRQLLGRRRSDRAVGAAVPLLADHGHGGHGAATSAGDPDDRTRRGGRVHLPQAVHAPAVRRQLWNVGSTGRYELTLIDPAPFGLTRELSMAHQLVLVAPPARRRRPRWPTPSSGWARTATARSPRAPSR